VSVEQQTQTDLEAYYDNESRPTTPISAANGPQELTLSPNVMLNCLSAVGNKTSIACNTSPSVSSLINGRTSIAATTDSKTNSTNPNGPSIQPKRLHVSNIPFRFRDPDLRQLFGVMFFKLVLLYSVNCWCSTELKLLSRCRNGILNIFLVSLNSASSSQMVADI